MMTHIILTISGPSQRCGLDSSCVCNNLCKMELLENYRRIQRIIGKIIDMLSKVKHRRSGSNSSSNNICKIIDMENRKLSKNIKKLSKMAGKIRHYQKLSNMAGSHIDSVNAAGQTPLAAAATGVAEIILKSQVTTTRYVKTKCINTYSITILLWALFCLTCR